jgi:hypothetical protein
MLIKKYLICLIAFGTTWVSVFPNYTYAGNTFSSPATMEARQKKRYAKKVVAQFLTRDYLLGATYVAFQMIPGLAESPTGKLAIQIAGEKIQSMKIVEFQRDISKIAAKKVSLTDLQELNSNFDRPIFLTALNTMGGIPDSFGRSLEIFNNSEAKLTWDAIPEERREQMRRLHQTKFFIKVKKNLLEGLTNIQASRQVTSGFAGTNRDLSIESIEAQYQILHASKMTRIYTAAETEELIQIYNMDSLFRIFTEATDAAVTSLQNEY